MSVAVPPIFMTRQSLASAEHLVSAFDRALDSAEPVDVAWQLRLLSQALLKLSDTTGDERTSRHQLRASWLNSAALIVLEDQKRHFPATREIFQRLMGDLQGTELSELLISGLLIALENYPAPRHPVAIVQKTSGAIRSRVGESSYEQMCQSFSHDPGAMSDGSSLPPFAPEQWARERVPVVDLGGGYGHFGERLLRMAGYYFPGVTIKDAPFITVDPVFGRVTATGLERIAIQRFFATYPEQLKAVTSQRQAIYPRHFLHGFVGELDLDHQSIEVLSHWLLLGVLYLVWNKGGPSALESCMTNTLSLVAPGGRIRTCGLAADERTVPRKDEFFDAMEVLYRRLIEQGKLAAYNLSFRELPAYLTVLQKAG